MHSEYKNPLVRQLAWCLCSPPLYPLADARLFNADPAGKLSAWLTALDENPAPLALYLSQVRSVLLGIRFERYLQFFCQYGPDMQLHAANLQVSSAGITQGEYDLLCSQAGEDLHLEAAVKFYLCLPNCSGTDPAHWYGPQNHDRLDLKLAKLHQQLSLSHSAAGQQRLQELGLNPHPSPRYLLNGMLFGQWQNPAANPAPASLRGYWLWQSQANALLDTQAHWQLLDKTLWLGPNLISSVLSAQQVRAALAEHFATQDFARMLVSLQWDGARGVFQEQQRYMLVPDNWPFKN